MYTALAYKKALRIVCIHVDLQLSAMRFLQQQVPATNDNLMTILTTLSGLPAVVSVSNSGRPPLSHKGQIPRQHVPRNYPRDVANLLATSP